MKTMLILLAMMIAQDPVTYDARYAQERGTVGQVKLNTGAKNMTIAPGATLPAGFSVSVAGQSLVIDMDAAAALPGLYDAVFTVLGQYKPIDDWRGPWIDGSNTLTIQWIVFDPTLANFFSGSPNLDDLLITPAP